MPNAILGTRRLYDALGMDTAAAGEIRHKVDLAIGKSVSVYLGPTPPLGIITLEGAQYGIPGRSSHILQARSDYKSSCFLEIAISASIEISPEQFRLLQSGHQGTQSALLAKEQNDSETLNHLLDAISGILGLRIHRQLVLKPLIENSFLSGDFTSTSSFEGPAMEMLEGLNTNSSTSSHVLALLTEERDTPANNFMKGGAILHWLLKAWRERDSISKFMYLFIPLEAILQTTDELASDSKSDLDSLEAIVRNSNAHDREALLGFLDRAKTRFGPTLNSRFEELAQRHAIPGWELDVQAFKKYNRMRNLLLHAGNRNIRGHINFDENARTLEDLVERYVAIALLGTREVYQSRWRPLRPPAT